MIRDVLSLLKIPLSSAAAEVYESDLIRTLIAWQLIKSMFSSHIPEKYR